MFPVKLANKIAMASGLFAVVGYSMGQTPEISHVLEWEEVVAGSQVPVSTPNGLLEPGEAALVSISVSFTPFGTPVAYQTPAPGGVAPVAGLAGSGFNLIATGAMGGEWSGFVLHHGFSASVPPIPDPSGSVQLCGIGQTYPPLGSWPLSMNPLPQVWQGVWTPSSYEPRQAVFEQRPIQSFPVIRPHVYVYIGMDPSGNPRFGDSIATGVYGSVQIPIVPAPAVGVVLCLGLGAAARRARRG
jgi:hypothetical protein